MTPQPRQERHPGGRVTTDADGLVVQYVPAPRKQSDPRRLENLLWREIELAGLPLPDELEYHWARSENRMYRSDGFYRLPMPTLVEIDGGIWMPGGSGHSHPMHLETQHQRDNLAALLGFRLLRFTEKMIRSGAAVATLRRALQPAERLL